MRQPVVWLASLGVLVLAGLVVAIEPPEQAEQAPFFVESDVGQQATGRNIEATIENVQLASVIELDEFEGWRGTTEGVWVVATLTAETRIEPRSLTGFLLIDDLEFRGSPRLDLDGLDSWQLLPGIPTSGAVVFEIPRDLAETTTSARLAFSLNPDWRLDSLISTTVDLSKLPIENELLVAPAARVAP